MQLQTLEPVLSLPPGLGGALRVPTNGCEPIKESQESMGKVKSSNALARKELRKAHRQAAKEKKQQRHAKRAVQKARQPVKNLRTISLG